MFKARTISTILILAVLSGVTAEAAENPLSVFPKATGVIVRLKTPQKTLEAATALAKNVDEKAGQQAQFGMPALGLLISNPSLKGVDQQADWWLAVFPVQNGDPGVVFCIPTTDADALKDGLTGNYEFQTFEKWGIYTENKDAAAMIRQQIANKGDSLSALMDAKSTAIWDEGNLSIFINVPHLLQVYRGAFDQGVKQVEDFIDQMPAIVPAQQGVDMKPIAEMYSSMFQALVQSVKDAEGCVAALSVSGDGLFLEEYCHFTEGSQTAKELQKAPPAELDDLGQLPAGQSVYAAMKFDVGQVVRWAMKYSLQIVTQDDTEKQKQFQKLLQEYEKLNFGSLAMAFGLKSSKQGALRAYSIVEVNEPKTLQKLSQQGAALVSNYEVGGMKVKTTFEPEAETYGDIKADLARVKYEYDEQANPFQAQIQTQLNNLLYGSDGMVTRSFYFDNYIAQSIGGDRTSAQALLSALDGGTNIGGHAAFRATRTRLLSKANFLGLVDLPGLVASGMDMVMNAGLAPPGAIPFNENDLKEIRGETSFMGTSVAVEGHGIHAKTVVPVPQMQGIARFVRLIQKIEEDQKNAQPGF